MSLNRSETAQKLNVSLTTLDNWRRKGCPHTKTGKQVFFNIGTLKTWLGNHSGGELDYTQERAKLTRLQAERVTLDLEQQRGKLLPLEMVILAWQGQIANARAKLLALPPKVAAQVLGMESYVEIEQAIRDIIYEALDELAGDGDFEVARRARVADLRHRHLAREFLLDRLREGDREPAAARRPSSSVRRKLRRRARRSARMNVAPRATSCSLSHRNTGY